VEEPHQPCLLGFGEPAFYRIAVQGQLDERTVTHIGDARVETRSPQLTKLLVRVMDQAGLSGVLDTLHALHLPILLVQFVNNDGETQS